MTAQELFTYLTKDAGLDDATTKVIMDQVAKNEKVSGRAAEFKQKSEYDALETRAAALQAAAEKSGTYEKWYTENYTKIDQLQKDFLKYQERFGPLDAKPNGETKPAAVAAQLDEEAIAKIIDKRVQDVYGSRWSDLITGSGTLLEKHIRSGRKNNVDWKKIGEIAQTKGGDLNTAYEEWDRPEAEAASKAAMDAEVDRRVKEGIAKQQTQTYFPAGAEGASSGPSGITRGNGEKKYDRSAVVQAAITGRYDGAAVN